MGTHKGISGKFTPKNPQKYKGKINEIYFRSLLERQYMKIFDETPNVVEWGSETVIVPYKWDVDGKQHRYFVDFYIIIKLPNGNVSKLLIEIKPKQFLQKPATTTKKGKPRNSATIMNEMSEYIKNQNKWEAADKFSKNRGMSFLVLTEDDIDRWLGRK